MLDFRLKSLKEFFSHHQPGFGPDLDFIDFQDHTYYTRVSQGIAESWKMSRIRSRTPSTVLGFRKRSRSSSAA